MSVDPAEYETPQDFLLARSQREIRRLEVENLQLLEDKQRLLEEMEARMEHISQLESALSVAKKQASSLDARAQERNGAMRQRLKTLEEESVLRDEQLRRLVEVERVHTRTKRMHDENISVRADLAHMRADNARLLQLLSSTQEYQQLTAMLETGNHTFVPSDCLADEDANVAGTDGGDGEGHLWPPKCNVVSSDEEDGGKIDEGGRESMGTPDEQKKQRLQSRRRRRRVREVENARSAFNDTDSMRLLYHGASPLGISVFDLAPLAPDPILEGAYCRKVT
jgi:hypothetical protein